MPAVIAKESLPGNEPAEDIQEEDIFSYLPDDFAPAPNPDVDMILEELERGEDQYDDLFAGRTCGKRNSTFLALIRRM